MSIACGENPRGAGPLDMKRARQRLLDAQTVMRPIKASIALRTAQEARAAADQAEAAAIILDAMNKASSLDKATAATIRAIGLRRHPA
jgi:hypothetical protein